MNKNGGREFNLDETKVADLVADEILTFDDKEDRNYFILLLFLLICLIFLVASLSFAVFDTYYNGSRDNSADVQIDVDSDDDKDEDKDEDRDKDKYDDKDEDDLESNLISPIGPSIDYGKIYFSYNTGSNYIKMDNVFPMKDDLGMLLTGDKQYFDFNVETIFKNKKNKNLIYEISIVPDDGNTIPDDDVRVYLTEDGSSVSVLGNEVNNFSDLPDSKYHKNGKVIFRKKVNDNYSADYIYRMWLSYDANVSEKVKTFSCKIAVDAYSK